MVLNGSLNVIIAGVNNLIGINSFSQNIPFCKYTCLHGTFFIYGENCYFSSTSAVHLPVGLRQKCDG